LVPVLDSNKQPLMPCSEKRARKLMEKKEAKAYWHKGIFCIILQKEPSSRATRDVVIGIDPGSKRTGVTVATETKVVLNIQLNTPWWVKDAVKLRSILRRSRRRRKTPYRKCRYNRTIGCIPPSTKARWQAHTRVIDAISKIVPITDIVVEDLCAESKKGQRRWNVMFSPLEVGKQWFGSEVEKRGLRSWKHRGFETHEQRNYRGFKKTSNKLKDTWEAHCVDSHCLCELVLGDIIPFKGFYKFDFMQWHRRQLHVANPKEGKRKTYGSTVSLGIPRGMLILHPKYGKCLVGGSSNRRVSLHSIREGKRLSQDIRKEDCKLLAKQIWKGGFLSSTLRR